MNPSEDALNNLLKALPRCCSCEDACASIIDAYRWPLCERCWTVVPGSSDDKPLADMREAVASANTALRISLAHSFRPSRTEKIPPPPSVPPETSLFMERALGKRNHALRKKLRALHQEHEYQQLRVALRAFALGVVAAITFAGIFKFI